VVISTHGYNGRGHSKQKPRIRTLSLNPVLTHIEVMVLSEVQLVSILVQEPTVASLVEAVGMVVRNLK
jgi:hypothetical protein